MKKSIHKWINKKNISGRWIKISVSYVDNEIFSKYSALVFHTIWTDPHVYGSAIKLIFINNQSKKYLLICCWACLESHRPSWKTWMLSGLLISCVTKAALWSLEAKWGLQQQQQQQQTLSLRNNPITSYFIIWFEKSTQIKSV